MQAHHRLQLGTLLAEAHRLVLDQEDGGRGRVRAADARADVLQAQGKTARSSPLARSRTCAHNKGSVQPGTKHTGGRSGRLALFKERTRQESGPRRSAGRSIGNAPLYLCFCLAIVWKKQRVSQGQCESKRCCSTSSSLLAFARHRLLRLLTSEEGRHTASQLHAPPQPCAASPLLMPRIGAPRPSYCRRQRRTEERA